MSIITINHLKYNYGIDIGDGLMCNIINKNIIPYSNNIKIIIPELNDCYNINIFIGDNILTSDNIKIYSMKINSDEKVIYIEFVINTMFYYSNLILIIVYSKTKILLKKIIHVPNIVVNYIEKTIDTYNIRLKYEVLECINTIKQRIQDGIIKISVESLDILNQKIEKISNMINELPNQKLLEINNNLKNKFFI